MAFFYIKQAVMNNQILFDRLQELHITNQTYSHKPLYTVQEALEVSSFIQGGSCKNLFLKDNKNSFGLL